MKDIRFQLSVLTILVFSATLSRAEKGSTLEGAVSQELLALYPKAEIILAPQEEWQGDEIPTVISDVKLILDHQNGSATFALNDVKTLIPFRALRKVPVAVQRIQPRQKLTSALFQEKEIDVSRGMARQQQGLILEPHQAWEKLQARQTVLEGHYPLSSSVEKIPDVKRGESVKINVKSGTLTLSTLGIAQEPSYLGEQVRVITSIRKKELRGTLNKAGTVEVEL